MSIAIKNFKRSEFYRHFRKAILKSRAYQILNIVGYALRTRLVNLIDSSDLDAVNTFCLFIGHGRSGHSIVGALLDAHPNVILSDETDALKYLIAGFDCKQLYRTLILRSQKQARMQRRKGGGLDGKSYSYRVPGQWQGEYKRLLVIGDSKASISVRRLYNNLDLLEKLKKCTNAELRIVHVVRNPFDNISTISIQHSISLEDSMEQYFYNCDAVMEIRKFLAPEELIVVHHEELIANPKAFLIKLAHFIGVHPSEDYLEACSSIIYKSPSKTRQKVSWKSDLINAVEKDASRFDFLANYSYDD